MITLRINQLGKENMMSKFIYLFFDKYMMSKITFETRSHIQTINQIIYVALAYK